MGIGVLLGCALAGAVHASSRTPGATLEAGLFVQVSRLGMPLVNEVVIGLRDKDRFNSSEPKDDAQFAAYVTNPTLPELLDALQACAANSDRGSPAIRA
jgi:hypothetical protein